MATKYERIADQIRPKILSGEYAEGEQLPAETTMADRYHVSVPTVRQAMAVLRSEGLVVSLQGKGNFVRGARPMSTRTPERYQWEKDRVRLPDNERGATGATEKDTGLEFTDLEFFAEYLEVDATTHLAEIFGIADGTKLLQRNYITRSTRAGAPISIVRSYLVRDVVAENPDLLNSANEPWPGGTQHQLSTINIELDRIDDEITTRPPYLSEAEVLGLPSSGVAVFELHKTSIDTTGRVVEYSEVILPGDRTKFSYTTQLARWENS